MRKRLPSNTGSSQLLGHDCFCHAEREMGVSQRLPFFIANVPLLFSRIMSLAFAYFYPKSGPLVCIDHGIDVVHPPATATYSDSY